MSEALRLGRSLMRKFGVLIAGFATVAICLMGLTLMLAGDDAVVVLPAQNTLFVICLATLLFGAACIGYDHYFPSPEERERREKQRAAK